MYKPSIFHSIFKVACVWRASNSCSDPSSTINLNIVSNILDKILMGRPTMHPTIFYCCPMVHGWVNALPTLSELPEGGRPCILSTTRLFIVILHSSSPSLPLQPLFTQPWRLPLRFMIQCLTMTYQFWPLKGSLSLMSTVSALQCSWSNTPRANGGQDVVKWPSLPCAAILRRWEWRNNLPFNREPPCTEPNLVHPEALGERCRHRVEEKKGS